jgi:ABC-type antimicrobial peptide transport system permease subunit
MLMSVFERTQEFGVLMAVGMESGKVRTLIMLEASALGLCGAFLGVLSGAIVTRILQFTGIDLSVAADGLAEFGMDTVLYPQVGWVEYFSIFVMVIVVSVIAALYPARQIIKQRPVEAMADKH